MQHVIQYFDNPSREKKQCRLKQVRHHDAPSRLPESTRVLQSKLPQELRDYIHTLCVQGSLDNEVIIRAVPKNNAAFYIRQPISEYSYRWIEDPIFSHLSPNRLGLDHARELLAAYYKTRTFKFAHRELHLIPVFLNADKFGLGIRADDHIRRLHISIELPLHTHPRNLEALHNDINNCCVYLEALAAVRARTEVVIYLDLGWQFSNEEPDREVLVDAAEIVLKLVELVNALVDKRVKIELMLEGAWNEIHGVKVPCRSITSIEDCVTYVRVGCSM